MTKWRRKHEQVFWFLPDRVTSHRQIIWASRILRTFLLPIAKWNWKSLSFNCQFGKLTMQLHCGWKFGVKKHFLGRNYHGLCILPYQKPPSLLATASSVNQHQKSESASVLINSVHKFRARNVCHYQRELSLVIIIKLVHPASQPASPYLHAPLLLPPPAHFCCNLLWMRLRRLQNWEGTEREQKSIYTNSWKIDYLISEALNYRFKNVDY